MKNNDMSGSEFVHMISTALKYSSEVKNTLLSHVLTDKQQCEATVKVLVDILYDLEVRAHMFKSKSTAKTDFNNLEATLKKLSVNSLQKMTPADRETTIKYLLSEMQTFAGQHIKSSKTDIKGMYTSKLMKEVSEIAEVNISNMQQLKDVPSSALDFLYKIRHPTDPKKDMLKDATYSNNEASVKKVIDLLLTQALSKRKVDSSEASEATSKLSIWEVGCAVKAYEDKSPKKMSFPPKGKFEGMESVFKRALMSESLTDEQRHKAAVMICEKYPTSIVATQLMEKGLVPNTTNVAGDIVKPTTPEPPRNQG